MTIQWYDLCITDKNGKRSWGTTASEMAVAGELRALDRHLVRIKSRDLIIDGLDAESAYIALDGEKVLTLDEMYGELEKWLE